jgi:hypothetical protein
MCRLSTVVCHLSKLTNGRMAIRGNTVSRFPHQVPEEIRDIMRHRAVVLQHLPSVRGWKSGPTKILNHGNWTLHENAMSVSQQWNSDPSRLSRHFVHMMIEVSWDFVPCGSGLNRRFGEHITSTFRVSWTLKMEKIFSETSVLTRATFYKISEDIYHPHRRENTTEDSVCDPTIRSSRHLQIRLRITEQIL